MKAQFDRQVLQRKAVCTLLAALVLVAASFSVRAITPATATARHAASRAMAGNSNDQAAQAFYAASEGRAGQEGQQSYGQRPSGLQAVMQRMYVSDTSFHALSALLVDHTPGLASGSLRIYIRQPDTIRTAAYSDDSGTGVPTEETVGQGTTLSYYLPRANVAMQNYRPLADTLPPLAQVPLTVVQAKTDWATIYGIVGTPAIEARLFIQPAQFVTSSFFTDKAVTVNSQASYAGRAAWLLDGTQVRGVPPPANHVNRWRVWVDKATGIILRMEYYASNRVVGWAEMRDLNIDGAGRAPLSTLRTVSVPATAHEVTSIRDYIRQARQR